MSNTDIIVNNQQLGNDGYRGKTGVLPTRFGNISEWEQLFCFQKHLCRKK
jgi:hypothetical protein